MRRPFMAGSIGLIIRLTLVITMLAVHTRASLISWTGAHLPLGAGRSIRPPRDGIACDDMALP